MSPPLPRHPSPPRSSSLRAAVGWAAIALAASACYVALQSTDLLPAGLAEKRGNGWLDPATHAWYPAAALTVALVVLFGRRALLVPLVLLPVTELTAAGAHAPLGVVATVTVLHTVAYGGAGLWLRRRHVDLRDTGMADLLRLVVAAAFAAPTITGFGAALAVHIAHPASFEHYSRDALAWATRDMVAVLVAASLPFAIVGAWHDRRPLRRVTVLAQDRADRALLAVQVAVVAASIAVAFVLGSGDSHPLYLASPGLLWLAATRGHRYATIGVSFFGVGLAIVNATEQVPSDLTGLRLQIAGLALLALAVGAQVDDRRRSALAHDRVTTALEMSEARYRTVLETAADGVLVVDDDGVIDIANAAVERITGRDRDDIEGSSLLTLLPAPEGVDPDEHLASVLVETTPGVSSGGRYVTGRRVDGSTFPAYLGVSRLDRNGQVAYTLIVRDESDRKEFEELLSHRATHDALTDLPNRVLFSDRLQTSLDRLRRQPGAVAVMLIDLDRFKAINDTLGHATGDRVLQEAAHRLRAAVRRSDTVARLGGDEFAILCESAVDHPAAVHTAQRVLQSLARPYDDVPRELAPTASIGIRVVNSPDDPPHDIVREADAALYRAKRDGRACYRVFTDQRRYDDRTEPIDLRERLDAGALVVHYQPVIDAGTGEIVSVEALARLRDREGRVLPPSDFIADAERSGLIDRLGELVLRQATAEVARLRAEAPELRVSVNVSPRQLADTSLTSAVARALSDARLPSEALTIEITETASLATVPRAGAVVQAIADMGVQIALDDFGTGASSLELLRALTAEELKIDRSFVQGVVHASVERDIVAMLIDLAHRRSMRVVAEGVETIDQASALAALGCDHLQGFLYSRPLPIDELEALLAQGARSMPSSATRSSATASSERDDRRPNRSAQS